MFEPCAVVVIEVALIGMGRDRSPGMLWLDDIVGSCWVASVVWLFVCASEPSAAVLLCGGSKGAGIGLVCIQVIGVDGRDVLGQLAAVLAVEVVWEGWVIDGSTLMARELFLNVACLSAVVVVSSSSRSVLAIEW